MGDDPPHSSGDYFCSDCFKAQMLDKYRREISKSKHQPKREEKILILHCRSHKSDILLSLIDTLCLLEPNRRGNERYYVYYVDFPANPEPQEVKRFKVISEYDPKEFDRIYHPLSMNDLSKQFFSEICRASPHEIPQVFQVVQNIFPLSAMTDEELLRLFSMYFPYRQLPPPPPLLKANPLDKLVASFVDNLTKEKPSTCNIIYKTCKKLS